MYPTPNSEGHTSICHDFSREWKKMGHDVKVIHFKSIFPIIFYQLASLFRSVAIKIAGNDNIDLVRTYEDVFFIKDDVSIYSFPIFKYFPHGKYQKNTISDKVKKIDNLLKLEKFKPDIIIGHFYNPQIEIVSRLKRLYPDSKSCIVLHEKVEIIQKLYSKKLFQYKDYIDVWGFRSESLRRGFENIYWKSNGSFINYSGIPNEFINKKINPNLTIKLRNFLYVGQLIERKFPSSLVPALKKAIPSGEYSITYVGSGSKDKDIISAAKKNGTLANISLKGKISRKEVLGYYDHSDCFIMISKNEAFGLVYLEAMSRGCITIAARNEGMDGVIIHGINGFLCEAGNSVELADLIIHIDAISEVELMRISKKAIETANKMSNEKTARNYIEAIQCSKVDSLKNKKIEG